MPFRLFIIIFVMVLIIFGMHLFFFKSLVYFFNITRPSHKIAFYAATVILTAVVITGFLGARLIEAWWTPGCFRFAATWLGFLIHFLVAVVLAWGAAAFTYAARLPAGRGWIAALLLVAAFAYSIYGIFNAYSLRVKEIPVALESVPPTWKNSRIVHLTDIHLGHMHGKSSAERLVVRVNRLSPDLIVITGDIFDGMGGDHETLAETIGGLEAEKGVFYVSGNHEDYIGKKRALQLLETTPMTRLADEMIEIDGLELIGISYPGIDSMEKIANMPEDGKQEGNVRILLFHTPTSIISQAGNLVNRHFTTYWMPDTSFFYNRKLDIDIQLSGHTHHGQILPFRLVTRILYRGYDYGLNRAGDLYIYTSSGTGTWGPPMRTATISEITVIRLMEKQPEKSKGETHEN